MPLFNVHAFSETFYPVFHQIKISLINWIGPIKKKYKINVFQTPYRKCETNTLENKTMKRLKNSLVSRDSW